MKTYKVVVELKNGTREEVEVKAQSRDEVKQLVNESFPNEVINCEIVEEM